jgi:hypothetical protein
MQDGARFFAYATWTLMVSLAIIIFTHSFLSWISDPGWAGTIVLLAFGFVYLNLTYAAVKRFIRKVPAPTNAHLLLAFLIFLPPFIWIYTSAGVIGTTEILIFTVLAFACGLGAWHGNKAGIKARHDYVQTLKERESRSDTNSNNGKQSPDK